jgi:hypothetical protein
VESIEGSEVKHFDHRCRLRLEGKAEALKDICIEAGLHNERLISQSNSQCTSMLFQPTRFIMEKEGGRFVDSRRAAAMHQRNDRAPGAVMFSNAIRL